jgi:glutathione synthase/RimK-type ligase-like ATP-grasp enzyme
MTPMAVKHQEPHVLIISTKLDMATDVVVRLLNSRGVRITRLNTEDFPFNTLLTTELSFNSHHSSVVCSPSYPPVSLDDVSSIWYRRVRSPEKPAQMQSGIYDFCLRESRSALLGMTLAQPVRIMSSPENIWAAEHKTMQLMAAQSVGLLIPETVVTNDPFEVKRAFERFDGRMIAKPVRAGFVDLGEEQYSIFTSQVLESHLDTVEDARWSPTIYQPLVEKRCDIRATIVGTRIFAAEIDSQTNSAARVDWRHSSTPDLPHHKAMLPHDICEGIHRLLHKLGLAFGAIDFIRTPEGKYVFLEINPNGQWLWLDDILDLGISESVADWLCEHAQ